MEVKASLVVMRRDSLLKVVSSKPGTIYYILSARLQKILNDQNLWGPVL